MKNITVLRDTGNGVLEHAEIALEPCPEAKTGWGVATLGGPDPIDADETTELMGWGDLDGEAIVHRGYRIPCKTIENGGE